MESRYGRKNGLIESCTPLMIKQMKNYLKFNDTNPIKKGQKVEMGTLAAPKVGDWFWHIHHEKLVEKLTEPLAHRIEAIRRKDESPARTFARLFLMRPVQNPPVSVAVSGKAKTDGERAVRNLTAAKQAYNRGELSYAGYNLLSKKYAPVIAAGNATTEPTAAAWEALHKKECDPDCSWNGSTIFPFTFPK